MTAGPSLIKEGDEVGAGDVAREIRQQRTAHQRPSGPISHERSVTLIERRIGPAKSEMNDPRSSVMSAKMTCGDETWKPCSTSNVKPKSIRIAVEIDGRMFPRSAPSVEKSTTAFTCSIAPPSISGLKMSVSEPEPSSENVSLPSWFGSAMSIEPLKNSPEISFVCALTGAWWLPSH